jgi:hypothetical protein
MNVPRHDIRRGTLWSSGSETAAMPIVSAYRVVSL